MYTMQEAKLLRHHALLLADRGRTESYGKAIAQSVRPGDVVLDIGTGTGVLAFFACRAGARRVYAIEASPAIEVAQEVAARNGLRDRIVFLNDFSFNVVLPEPVDLIVTETGESFGLQGGAIGSVVDARRRFLRKGGRVIPQSLELFVAPVEAADSYRAVDTWKQNLYGFDFSPVRTLAANNAYAALLNPANLLGDPASLARVAFSEAEGTYVKGATRCVAKRAGVLHGICGWAVTELVPGIAFSNSPEAPSVEWTQTFLPLEIPVSLHPGDFVEVHVSSNNGAVWRWQIKVNGPADVATRRRVTTAKFDHSTLSGSLLSRAELSKTGPAYRPKLSRRGEAAQFILEAFTGERTIADLENELLRRYGDVFPSPAAAL